MAKKTKVIFRKYVKSGDVIALFPEEEWCEGCITSYLHIGQHAAADYDYVMSNTLPATFKEYAHLLNELRNVGYINLEIVEK